MALVDGRWFCVIEYADKQGKKDGGGLLRFELGAADYADAETIQAAIHAAWANVSNCAILKSYVYQEMYEDAYVQNSAHGERENQIEWNWQLPNPLKSHTSKTPGAIEGCFVALSGPNNNIIDLVDAGVVAWETLYTDGDILASDGETAADLISGKRVHIRSKKSAGTRRG